MPPRGAAQAAPVGEQVAHRELARDVWIAGLKPREMARNRIRGRAWGRGLRMR
jgi:hypothetical protein